MPGVQRTVTLRFLAAPMDANERGVVGGGTVLEWIDKAGYACAVGWSGTYCVTAYVGHIEFRRPIPVGSLVEITSRIVHTGRTSIHIECTVASGDPREPALAVNTQCVLIFVAMHDGRPTPIPEWRPETEEDRLLQERAVFRMEGRKAIEADMARQRYTEATESWRQVLRFLAAPSDVNWGGKVHGGSVMRWIATDARLVAETWQRGPAVAVFGGGVRFYRPLLIGDLVEVEGRLIHTGSTSMQISVHVRSGDPTSGELRLTTHCAMVYVAVDESGRKVPARPWVPQLPEDVALDQHARTLIEIRRDLARPLEFDRRRVPPDLTSRDARPVRQRSPVRSARPPAQPVTHAPRTRNPREEDQRPAVPPDARSPHAQSLSLPPLDEI